jgi:hypothetical protein
MGNAVAAAAEVVKLEPAFLGDHLLDQFASHFNLQPPKVTLAPQGKPGCPVVVSTASTQKMTQNQASNATRAQTPNA